MVAEQTRAIVRRAVEQFWNRGALDLVDERFATHSVNHHGLLADLVGAARVGMLRVGS